MPVSTGDRFHSLSIAYNGFYPSANEEINKVSFTENHKQHPVVPAHVADDQIGEVEVSVDEMLKPPYFPVMSSESVRMPLGGPQDNNMMMQQQQHNNNEIVLTKLEFAVLCTLSGAGIAFMIMHLSQQSAKPT
jgi:hypothetical protein